MASQVFANDDLTTKIISFQKGSLQHRRLCKDMSTKYSSSFKDYFGENNILGDKLKFTVSNFEDILQKVGKLMCPFGKFEDDQY